jgi:hypothetical protein
MRKMTLAQLQSQIRLREREINQAVFEFKQSSDDESWNRLRNKVRTEDECHTLD